VPPDAESDLRTESLERVRDREVDMDCKEPEEAELQNYKRGLGLILNMDLNDSPAAEDNAREGPFTAATSISSRATRFEGDTGEEGSASVIERRMSSRGGC
jgi:hypothetical protein